ncbi:MAG: transcriptional repressor [Tissierellia bacterium]|nr:transcriptional repressor [Tissierellia bacterium]
MDYNLEKAKEILKDNDYKFTWQRKLILEFLSENTDKHLSCDEIYDSIVAENPEIGIATIYRNILTFEKLNIVTKLNLNDGISRYELNDFSEEGHQHHHLICVNCGKIIEVKKDLLDNLEQMIEKDLEFKVKDHSLKFYGYCSECNNLMENKEK